MELVTRSFRADDAAALAVFFTASVWTAQAMAMIGDASALRLYERTGFAVERYWYTMTAPPTSGPICPG